MPSLRDGIGPHYHMAALTPVVVLAASGACWLWRCLPGRFLPRPARGLPARALVAGGCLLALAAVTVPAIPGKVRVQRYVNTVDEHVLGLVPDDLGGPAVVIVAPPLPSWYTQVPYHLLRNSPDLSDEVLYAADIGPAIVGLAARMPERRLYRLRPDELPAADGLPTAAEPGSPRGSFVELRTVTSGTINVRVSVTVPAGHPYAQLYLRLGDRAQTYPLATGTDASGAARTVTWTLDGRSDSSLGGLPRPGAGGPAADTDPAEVGPAAELVVGLVAGGTPDLAGPWRWEERIPLQRRSDGSLVLLAPGAGFRQTPELPAGAWEQVALTGTLDVALEPIPLPEPANR